MTLGAGVRGSREAGGDETRASNLHADLDWLASRTLRVSGGLGLWSWDFSEGPSDRSVSVVAELDYKIGLVSTLLRYRRERREFGERIDLDRLLVEMRRDF